MATITPLRSEQDLWKIKQIPRYKTEEDVTALRLRLQQRFRIKGDRTVVVISKRGEILTDLADVESITELYRTQGAISMIIFVFGEVKLLTHIHSDTS